MEQTKSMKMSRGLRLNNPGNIRLNTRNKWLGMAADQPDGSFCKFASLAYGFRAMWKLLYNYWRGGHQTIARIIHRWAPPSENNTGAYIWNVAHSLHWEPDTPLPSPYVYPDIWEKLILTITRIEQGLSDSAAQDLQPDVAEGYRLFQPTRQPTRCAPAHAPVGR